MRAIAALVVAVVLAVIGLTLALGLSKPAGTVFDHDFRGPKVSIDGGPQVDRAPRFRVLVGDSRKMAHWHEVNVVQYATCSTGDSWRGWACAKFDLPKFALPAGTLRWAAAAGVVVLACVVTVATSGNRG